MTRRLSSIGLLALVLSAGCGGTEDLVYSCPPVTPLCAVPEARSCYDGPAGTEGIGLCQAGTQTCTTSFEGAFFSACTGQVLPAPDDCTAPTSFSCGTANQCGSISAPSSALAAQQVVMSADSQGNLAFYRIGDDPIHGVYAVEKWAPEGEMLWRTPITNVKNIATGATFSDCSGIEGVIHAPNDDVVIFGRYGGIHAVGDQPAMACSIDLGGGPLPDAVDDSSFVARYRASDGKLLWMRSFSAVEGALAINPAGGFVMFGAYLVPTSLGTVQLPPPPASGTDPYARFVAWLDEDGEPLSAHTASGVSTFAVDATGAIFTATARPITEAATYCARPAGLELAALEADGTPRFQKTFGDANVGVEVLGMALDGAGRVAIAGWLNGIDLTPGPLDLGGVTVAGHEFVAVFDGAHGDVVWARSLHEWEVSGIAFDARGNLLLAGAHQGRVAAARYTQDGTLFSLTSSDAGTPEFSSAVRSGDKIWIAAGFSTGTGYGDVPRVDLFHADP